MENSKTPPVSNPSKFSSAIFSISLAVFFVALIHVEIEMHAHRQMLQILNQEREDTNELRNIVVRQEETIDSVLKILLSGSPKGKCILIKLALVRSPSSTISQFFSDFHM